MNGDNYIPNATTETDHLNNVFFQAANVRGWLKVPDVAAARIKAECLLRDAESLVAKLEAIERAGTVPGASGGAA